MSIAQSSIWVQKGGKEQLSTETNKTYISIHKIWLPDQPALWLEKEN